MRSIRQRSIIVCLLTLVFVVGLATYVVRLVLNAEKWALDKHNPRLGSAGVTDLGVIKDCNDVVLAQTINDKRLYSTESKVRMAMLHVVGDDASFIDTSIQSNYQTGIWGYNIVTGLNPPEFISNKRDIKLTLDSKVCCKAVESMGKYKGAVIVYNYKTGKVVCMSSLPTYDPMSPPDLDRDYTGEYEGAYLNRALSASYTPGSIFKIITSIAALKHYPSVESEIFNCQHTYNIGDSKITCVGTHGNIGFNSAFVNSCNVAFAKIAINVGSAGMMDTTKELGFGESFEVSGVSTKKSKYNVSGISEVDLGWSGVGQYDTLVNPMHMLIILGAIANDGVPVMPYFVDSIISQENIEQVSAKEGSRLCSATNAAKIKDMMRNAVKYSYGDNAFGGMKEVCAKTGTAEVGENKKPNAWIAGFSKNESTPYAFVVVMENAGGGAQYAIPVAANVLSLLK